MQRKKVLNKYLNITDTPPIDGADIVTTINVSMQDLAERSLEQELKVDDPQKEEHLEEFRQLLEDNSVRVNGTLIYTSDETTWNEYSENNYSNWYANDDWYLSRCNFSLDKSYQFYKCIKTTW